MVVGLDKFCTKCQEVKTISCFSRNRIKPDGLSCWCKECQSRCRQENKEKIAARKKKYRKENKEKIAAWKKKYRKENKEKIAAAFKKWRQENKKKVAAGAKRWWRKNTLSMSSLYIVGLIRKQHQIPASQITPEMIELKREQLTIHREIKEIKNGLT